MASDFGWDRLTLLQHFAEEEKVAGAVVPPIFQTSLFVFDELADFANSFDLEREGGPIHNYSRVSNPTLEIVERKVAMLEGCEAAKGFGSGMGAISAAILSATRAGGHVVCSDTVYGPTRLFLNDYLCKFGVSVTFVDATCPENVFDACGPDTTLIYLESPGTFIFQLQDLEAIATFARQRGITTAIDNTYSTPLYQNPAQFGIDIVLHSASKYLGGHSDICAGILATSEARIKSILKWEFSLLGAAMSPMIAWLLLRGMRTLAARMPIHQATANRVASFLSERPEVAAVNHVGLPSFPQRDLFRKQMRGSGGLLSFEPATVDPERIAEFIRRLRIFQQGVSWGGHESLIVALPYEKFGWTRPGWGIRLYCGLESPEDLVNDLAQALPAFTE